MKLRISRGADRDISAIARRLGEKSRRGAERFVRGMDRSLAMLRQFPNVGTRRPDLGDEFRMVVLRPFGHIMLYAITDAEIIIAHVFDGRRDLKAALLDDQ
jgi:plasmid stabilization system protein ParE